MTPLAELSMKSQDQVLGAVASVQNSMASGYSKLSTIVAGKLPKSLPSMPTVPFAPKPAEVAALSFGFAVGMGVAAGAREVRGTLPRY